MLQGRLTIQALTVAITVSYTLIRQPEKLRQLDIRSRPGSVSVPIKTPGDGTEVSMLVSNPTRAARLMWLRGSTTALSLCFAYAGIARVAMSEYTTITSTRTFVIGFLCWVFLGEAFGWRLRMAAGESDPHSNSRFDDDKDPDGN